LKKFNNYLIVSLGLIALLVLVLFSSRPDLGRRKRHTVSSESVAALDFTLPDLDGNIVSLKDFENEVILLVFWVAGCDICKEEVPVLEEVYAKYNGKGVEVLAVNIGESATLVRKFKEQRGIRYRILLDSQGKVRRLYQVIGVPTEVIIDRQGKVRYYDFGLPYNWEEILDKLLK